MERGMRMNGIERVMQRTERGKRSRGGVVRVAAAVAMMLVAVACTVKPVDSTVVDTPRSGWSEPVELLCSADSTALHTIGVVLQMESKSVDGPIELRIGCTSPSGVSLGDTLRVGPARRSNGGSFTRIEGDWIEGARFAEQGDYSFTIEPLEPLDGVWMVGITIRPE